MRIFIVILLATAVSPLFAQEKQILMLLNEALNKEAEHYSRESGI